MSTPQLAASDPASSIWVSANAGTGKTKLLTDRVLRILLSGVSPSRILCITYTQAASVEMSNRVRDRLAKWAALPLSELQKELEALTGGKPTTAMSARAQRLLGEVLEAPGGLRIMTIHAFCQSLLRRFPVEAGVPPHFSVIDERTSDELMEDAKRKLFVGDHPRHDPALAESLTYLATLLSEHSFNETMDEVLKKRRHFEALLREERALEKLASLIHARLGVPGNATEASSFAELLAYTPEGIHALKQAAAALNEGDSVKDKELADAINAWFAEDTQDVGRFVEYKKAWLTQAANTPKKLPTKKFAEKFPEHVDALANEQQRVAALMNRLLALNIARGTRHLMAVVEALLVLYRHAKARRGALDFDDLILFAHALLKRPDIAPWVLFKLDGGIDHVLIDEAQDTSAEQWDLVSALVDEFFRGEGRSKSERTLFVVGDEKQSIYSFQGAAPKQFGSMQHYFASLIQQAEKPFKRVHLALSYRSTEAVLRSVDKVFAQSKAGDGLVSEKVEIQHELKRAGEGGRVEVWPIMETPKKDLPPPWTLPEPGAQQLQPWQSLAQKIAKTIAGWIATGEMLEAKGRPIQPGDIMILVRHRDRFVYGMVRALKRLGVPVAGSDRLALTTHIAIQDMMALGHALLLPQDDLTLACVLKSPLIGMGEEALFELAHDRGSASLWQRLQSKANDKPIFKEALDFLSWYWERADFMPPYELFAHVLDVKGGRKKMAVRLGEECFDPLDEFLSLAIAYESAHPPSLQGFLHWLAVSSAEIKRDMEQGKNEVRILTVHGAKGLQAPIVFMPDTTSTPMLKERLLWDVQGGERLFLWTPNSDADDAVCRFLKDDRRAEQDAEYRRLLYVAMTRAEDRLYVGGWLGARDKLAENSWYGLIRAGLSEENTQPEDTIVVESKHELAFKKVTAKTSVEIPAAPEYLGMPYTREEKPIRPVAPSRLETEGEKPLSPLKDTERFERGRLVHRLLQYLPECPETERNERALAYLARTVPHWEESKRVALAGEIMAVLSHKTFAPVFGENSAAEVPVSGMAELPTGREVISAQIDRLLVTEKSVFIIDFKSNQQVPVNTEEIPDAYLWQLAAYATLLSAIYPGRAVQCALLWTTGPVLMPVDISDKMGRALDAA